MRLQSLRQKALTLGLLSLGSAGVVTNAMSGEFLHRVHPSRYVEAPVEPAPPNAGYYPTRWNRWDSEQAYLPGLHKPQGPAETPPTGEELPQPKGDVAPPPLEKSAPKRDGDTAPRPGATAPKPGVPAPLPGGGDLPPLPSTPGQLPEPAPMPVKPEQGELPPPRQAVPAPAPDNLTPPPSVEKPKTQPKVEAPREPETSPPPMELPPPRLPREEKPPAPEPKAPELPLPEPMQPAPMQPEPQEPKKEPTDNLFEAPPRSGDKNPNKGASLPDRPSIRTIRAKGQWIAIGGAVSTENKPLREVAPVSDTEEAPLPAMDRRPESSSDGKPARLPVDDEAAPLSGLNQRTIPQGQSAMPVGSAMARFKPLHDAEVRGVSWTEPVLEAAQPRPNPLRPR